MFPTRWRPQWWGRIVHYYPPCPAQSLAGSGPVEVWSWGKIQDAPKGMAAGACLSATFHSRFSWGGWIFVDCPYDQLPPRDCPFPSIIQILITVFHSIMEDQLTFLSIIRQCTNLSTHVYTEMIWPSFYVKQRFCSPVMAKRKTSVHFDNISLIFYFRKSPQETIQYQ